MPDSLPGKLVSCDIIVLHVRSMMGVLLQSEVTSVLLEGTRGSKQGEGGSMKGTIAKRFEELDWDNNGQRHTDTDCRFGNCCCCVACSSA